MPRLGKTARHPRCGSNHSARVPDAEEKSKAVTDSEHSLRHGLVFMKLGAGEFCDGKQ